MHRLHLSNQRPTALHLPVLGGGVPTGKSEEVSEVSTPRLRTWPKPATDQLRVEVAGGGACSWRLFDLSGRVLASGEFFETATLNTEGLPAGLFALKVQDEKGRTFTEKVWIAR